MPRLTENLPGVGGALKTVPEDFIVEEIPAYPPSGEGHHVFLTVEKRGLTTHEMVRRIARALGVPQTAIGSAGQKDRQAIARQVISVPDVDPAAATDLQLDGIRVLSAVRHQHKLRTGHLKGNRFHVTLRGVHPDAEARARAILDALTASWLPNFFGTQRFGREMGSPRAPASRASGGPSSEMTTGATTPSATTPSATTENALTAGATTPSATTLSATTENALTAGATTPSATTENATTENATTENATTENTPTAGAPMPSATTENATTAGATTPSATTENAPTAGVRAAGAPTAGAPAAGAPTAGVPAAGAPTGVGDNAARGKALLLGKARIDDRFERRFMLSAYQSLLFNRFLARRLEEGLLHRVVDGEVLQRTETGGLFVSQPEESARNQARIEAREVVPTGPMFGHKMFAPLPGSTAQRREQQILDDEQLDPAAFARFGKLAEGTRRPLLVRIEGVSVRQEEDRLLLSFALPSGSYATVLLAELIEGSQA